KLGNRLGSTGHPILGVHLSGAVDVEVEEQHVFVLPSGLVEQYRKLVFQQAQARQPGVGVVELQPERVAAAGLDLGFIDGNRVPGDRAVAVLSWFRYQLSPSYLVLTRLLVAKRGR